MDFDQEWVLPGFELDGLDDKDVSHENHFTSNVDTLNLVTKAGTAGILRTMSQARKKNEMAEAKRVYEDQMKDQMEPIGEDTRVEWDGLRGRKTTISSQGSLERRKTLHPPLGMSAFQDVDEIEDTMNQCSTPHTFQHITDQEEGLEEHPDRPACPKTSESDITLDEAEILTSTKAIGPTCYLEGGPEQQTLPAESTAAMIYCETHKYMVEQDTATLRQLHRAGFFLDVRTLSADLSTELDATIALHWAAKSGCFRALKYLLDRGVNPCAIDNEERSQKRAALHYAASGGFAKEVDLLIERGADVQALDANSWSPLHHAATIGDCRISEALLKAGASVHSLNSFRETPLHCAARGGFRTEVDVLIEKGADVQALDANSWSPLHHAATGGSSRTSEALLKAGASVHLLNLSLETPLHCAARNGHERVVKLLLDWGADISGKDYEGFTPFDRAKQANCTIKALRILEVKKGKSDADNSRVYLQSGIWNQRNGWMRKFVQRMTL